MNFQTRFLVCPPPDSSSGSSARRQWDRFIETLSCAGDVALVALEPNEDVPGLQFTADAALVDGNLAIVSSFRHPERRRAQGIFRRALARAGLGTTYLRATYFEGAGDALLDPSRSLCYAGYGWRTERSAIVQLQEIIDYRVLPLLLVDERFFHLDMALCPLGSGHVLIYEGAFSPHAQRMLRHAIDRDHRIDIDIDDALCLACNAVEVGRETLVLHRASRKLRERLHDAGYRLFCTELDEFNRVGRSAKSLTLRLDADRPAA